MGKYTKRAEELVAGMTLEEKVSQTVYNAPAIERLGIPKYNWWNEALHGVARAGTATVFPQAIGLAASFDEELLSQVADVTATEARAKYNVQKKAGDYGIYKGLTFWSPNVNIFRDPRWGRGHETYGEDPWLSSRLGVRFIQSLQKEEGGDVEEEVLDQAVVRLMETRLKLGSLEKDGTVPFDEIPYEKVDCEKHRSLNREAARKVLVLLKNEDNLLPLDIQKLKTIGVIGPNADSRRALVGNYEGTASRYVTVLEGIQDYTDGRVRVCYSEGCHLCYDRAEATGEENDRISEVKAICEISDVVVVVLGLDAGLEGEEGDANNAYASGDKIDLKYPGLQSEVLRTAYESGKPVVLISMTGSAMDLAWEAEHIPAIIQAWYPGSQGGSAVAELLFGEYSPEGKLPVTFYKNETDIPDFSDYSMKNRTYRYMEKEALFPFGYGLGYTSFGQDKTEADTDRIEAGGQVNIKTHIKNTGAMAGAQTVQIYVKAVREGTPNAQLKGLKKVWLQPGEEKEVAVTLADTAFALYNENGERVLEEGEYAVYVGMQQPDKRSSFLTGQQPDRISVCGKYRL